MQLYRGQLETDDRKFQGDVRLKRFDDLPGTETRVFVLHFGQTARTNWHVHSGRQVMYGIFGRGCVKDASGQVVPLEAGDVLYLEPGVKHWHGASPDGGDFIHAVIAFDRKTFWEFRPESSSGKPVAETVSEEEYESTWKHLGETNSSR